MKLMEHPQSNPVLLPRILQLAVVPSGVTLETTTVSTATITVIVTMTTITMRMKALTS
jgi:hypothetical protein